MTSEEMTFENVEGRRMDGRRMPAYTISSPMSLQDVLNFGTALSCFIFLFHFHDWHSKSNNTTSGGARWKPRLAQASI